MIKLIVSSHRRIAIATYNEASQTWDYTVHQHNSAFIKSGTWKLNRWKRHRHNWPEHKRYITKMLEHEVGFSLQEQANETPLQKEKVL